MAQSSSSCRQPYVKNPLSPWPRISFGEATSESESSVTSAASVHTAVSFEPESESFAEESAGILQRPFISTVSNTRGRASQPVPPLHLNTNRTAERPNSRRTRPTDIGSATRYKPVPDNKTLTKKPQVILNPKAGRQDIRHLLALRQRKIIAAKNKGDMQEVYRLRHLGVWDDIDISNKTLKASANGTKNLIVQRADELEGEDTASGWRGSGISQGHTKELCAFMQEQLQQGVDIPREFVVCDIHCESPSREVSESSTRKVMFMKAEAKTKAKVKDAQGSMRVITTPLAPPSSPTRSSAVDEHQSDDIQQSPSSTFVSYNGDHSNDYTADGDETTQRSSISSGTSSDTSPSCKSTPTTLGCDIDALPHEFGGAGAQQLLLGHGNAKPAVALVDLLGKGSNRKAGFGDWSEGVWDAVRDKAYADAGGFEVEVEGKAGEGEEDVWCSLAWENGKENGERGCGDDFANTDCESVGMPCGNYTTSRHDNGRVSIEEVQLDESKDGENDDDEEDDEEDLWFALSLSLAPLTRSTADTSILASNTTSGTDTNDTIYSNSNRSCGSNSDSPSASSNTSTGNFDYTSDLTTTVTSGLGKEDCVGEKSGRGKGKGEDHFLHHGQELLMKDRAPEIPKSLRQVNSANDGSGNVRAQVSEDEVNAPTSDGGKLARKREMNRGLVPMNEGLKVERDLKREWKSKMHIEENYKEGIYKANDKGIAWWEEWRAVEKKSRW